MKTITYKLIMMLMVCGSLSVVAQTKKLDRTYKTNADVSVTIDASHTNIIVENWDRNEVQIEAALESGQADSKETKQLLESWKLETTGSAAKVSIVSGGGGAMPIPPMDMSKLNESLAKLPEIMEPVMGMIGPLLESMSNNPLPPGFRESMGELNFDHEAYKREGEKYLERWEKNVEKKFGKDFEKSMEKWASNIEKDTVLWKKDIEIRMEKWGEEFGAGMEAWGEGFGKEMEEWAEQFGKEMEALSGDEENKIFIISDHSKKAKKTIRIKKPEDARLELNVRHGEVRLGGRNLNVRGDISHSRFSASSISGKNTNIRASYSPVKVKNWEFGQLETAYVKDCEIESVKSLKLSSNSSDVKIGEVLDTGIISGTFGKLNIGNLAPGFNTLDISLENSDLILNLPDAPLNFSYTGSQSELAYPSSIKGTPVKNYDTEIMNGYQKSRSGKGTVSIKARYSDVVVK